MLLAVLLLQTLVDAAAPGATIRIPPGVYRQTLRIEKAHIHLVGTDSDPRNTVIVFDKSAGDSGGTLHSATVHVRADGFSAENLTFANDFNATHPQLPAGSQALALAVVADQALLRNVRLLGNQDTLYAAKGHQHYLDCYIEGNVDFIFGDARADFENCEIHSTPHKGGFITAQGKNSPDQDSGFVFSKCRLTAGPGVTGVWLGRPWRPYASVAFIDCVIADHIRPDRWREWHPGETHYLDTAAFTETGSTRQERPHQP